MAIKLATIKKKNGDIYHFQTSAAQVEGLNTLLANKQNNLTQAQLDAANSGATAELIDKISVNESNIGAIGTKIPSQATSDNQLADKDFVNSSINASAAHFVSYDASNSNFPTKAALLESTAWYQAGNSYVPKKNDYLVVTADESEGDAQTRYLVVSNFTPGTAPTTEIQLQYIINDAPFTAAQNSAINSGITTGKVANYDEIAANMSSYLKSTDASQTYASKAYVEGLGTVFTIQAGESIPAEAGDEDYIIEITEG